MQRILLGSVVLPSLACFACATPFPVDQLERGMTMGSVRTTFGEPVHEGPTSMKATSTWTYEHETIDPAGLVFTVLLAGLPALEGTHLVTQPVDLSFEDGELARWIVYPPVPKHEYAPPAGGMGSMTAIPGKRRWGSPRRLRTSRRADPPSP